MAVPILGIDRKLHFPLLTTSPAIPQAADTYLSDIALKDIEIQSIYLEKGKMEPDPGWDGTPYDWTEGVTEIQSDFVDLGSLKGGQPNLLYSTDLSGKDWGNWKQTVWDLGKAPNTWFYSDKEPSERDRIWVNTTKETNEPLFWDGTKWSSYFDRMRSLSKASIRIIEQKTGNSFEFTSGEKNYSYGVSQFIKIKQSKLEEVLFNLTGSLEFEETSKSNGIMMRVDFYDEKRQHLYGHDSPRFFNKTAGKKVVKDYVFATMPTKKNIQYVMFSILGIPNLEVKASINKAKLEYGTRYTGWTLHATESSLNLNAGEIPLPIIGGQPDKSKIISEIAILRSALGENLLKWEEVTRIKASSMKNAVLYDYFIENGNYYRYAIQPILANGTKGVITSAYDAVTTHEGFWMLGQDDLQFSFIYNGNIAEITHVDKDMVIETIASNYPYIVRPSDVKYRKFEFSGIFTYQQDVHKHFVAGTYSEAVSPLDTLPINFVELKYGDEMLLNCQNDLEEMEDGMVMQRLWREKILKWMTNGKPKILKSEAEGTMLVHIHKPIVRPIRTVYGLVAEFSCQIVEIGEVSEENLKKFKMRKEIITKDDLLKSSQNERGFYPFKNIRI